MLKMAKQEEKKDERQEYISKAVFGHGSNKDGSAKKKYNIGDPIKLTPAQAEVLRKQNKIQ